MSNYKISNTLFGGLPTTAWVPFMTIGRSMSLGFLTMAFMICSSVNSLPLKFSFHTVSCIRTSSMGLMPRSSISCFNSWVVGGFSRYFLMDMVSPFSSRSWSTSRDLLHLGLWYNVVMFVENWFLVSIWMKTATKSSIWLVPNYSHIVSLDEVFSLFL